MKRRNDIKLAVFLLKQMTPEQRTASLNDLRSLLNTPQDYVMLQFEKFWHISPKNGKKLKAIELLAKSRDPEKVEHILRLLQEKRTDCTKMACPGITYKRISMTNHRIMQEIEENKGKNNCFTADRLSVD